MKRYLKTTSPKIENYKQSKFRGGENKVTIISQQLQPEGLTNLKIRYFF